MLVALALVSGCVRQPEARVSVPGKLQITAEIADEPGEWATGLMFREDLDDDRGMLFVFPDDQERTFWMKNTEIPLDLLFISSENRVVEIMPTLQPCVADPCARYQSRVTARYVLEVNAGTVALSGVEVGDVVDFTLPEIESS